MKKKKILIVLATYYPEISLNLKSDTEKYFKKCKNLFISNLVLKVPGVFEIPVAISKNIKKYDAFVALGCVIKGETPHFDFISKSTTDAIMKLSVEHKKPIGNGILTCLNMNQAKIRSKKKGKEAANAVISLLLQ